MSQRDAGLISFAFTGSCPSDIRWARDEAVTAASDDPSDAADDLAGFILVVAAVTALPFPV